MSGAHIELRFLLGVDLLQRPEALKYCRGPENFQKHGLISGAETSNIPQNDVGHFSGPYMLCPYSSPASGAA